MIKRSLAILAAIIVMIANFPSSFGGDPGITGAIVKDRERYFHRLKHMRAQEPENPELSYRIANLYYSLEMEDEAIKEYRRTLKLKADHHFAKWFLSKLLVSKGYFEEAFWLARDLIAAHEDNPGFYAYAGEILMKMDQREAAKEYFNRFDELKYNEADGSKPISSHSQPGRGNWKEYFY